MLDTSAVLALVQHEPGADIVEGAIADAAFCIVNFAEAIGVLVRKGRPLDVALADLRSLDLDLVEFDEGLAIETGALIAATRRFGLSLGDRACLASAAREGIPAMTAERSWAKLNVGVDVQLIR